MKIFVTGGSGFVGGHAIERLAKSHTVLAMARSDRSAAIVSGFGATPVRTELDAVEPAHLEGCEAVVHAAAFVEEWGTREQFWKGNVEGTTRMLEVAKKAGVRRFIHIGTEAALFDGHDLVQVDERHPYPRRQRFLYSETKAEAERRVLAANGEGFVTIGLRPRLVWGPRDATILPAVLAMAKSGAFVWLDHGSKQTSTVHVANVAAAIELALTRGEGGQTYFIADDGTRTIGEFLKALLLTQGVTLTDRNLPGAIARPLASFVEGTWRALGIKNKPPLTAFAVAMMSREITVDTSKAKRDLGYTPVIDVEAGLRALPRL